MNRLRIPRALRLLGDGVVLAAALVCCAPSGRAAATNDFFAQGVELSQAGQFPEAAAAFGVFGLGEVTAAGGKADCFTGGGDFKPLGHGFSSLDTFGASHKSNIL